MYIMLNSRLGALQAAVLASFRNRSELRTRTPHAEGRRPLLQPSAMRLNLPPELLDRFGRCVIVGVVQEDGAQIAAHLDERVHGIVEVR